MLRDTMRNDHDNSTRRYLTDGGRLYRHIAWLDHSRRSMLAAVEDCRSLEILLVSGERLQTWREVSVR